MSTEVTLNSASTAERLRATVSTTADPTSNAVQWQLSSLSGQPGGTWAAGTWATTWVAPSAAGDDMGEADAASPITGTANFTLTQGTDYSVWCRFTVGAEVVVRRAGKLRVR